MKIIIKTDPIIPTGEYELTDNTKLEEAKAELGFGVTDREIILGYDRRAGRVVKEGKVFLPQHFWNLEKKRLEKPIEQFTDTELISVIRKGENFPLTKDWYQIANSEWQIRQQGKLQEATKGGRSGVFFEVGGDMTNHGVIQTDKNAVVDIAVAGNYSSNEKTKIIQGSLVPQIKHWFEKPFGIVVLGVIITLVASGLVYWFGWN